MGSTANETRRLSLLGQLLTTGFSQSTRSYLQNLARCHLTQGSTPQRTFSTHVMAQQLAGLSKKIQGHSAALTGPLQGSMRGQAKPPERRVRYTARV